jgi:phosphoglycerate-specific signal transduction histidine kinase
MIDQYQGSKVVKGDVLTIRTIGQSLPEASKSELKKLHERKKKVMETLEKVTYGLLMGDQEIASILSNINMRLSGEALVKSVEYEMNFAKAKGLN